MKPSTINIIIAIISALATVVAAIIYYLTLEELKKQRENTARPHLFIDKTYFNVQGVRKGDYLIPIKWTTEKMTSVILEFTNEINIAKFFLKCYNIGFGTATNVSVEFYYDIDLFISKISELEKEVKESDRIKIEKNNVLISFSTENEEMPPRKFGLTIENNLKHYVTYVLPVNIKNEPVNLRLPSHYLELLNVYVFYFMSIENKEDLDYSVPEITTKINYSDINKKQMEESFTIVTNLNAMSLAGYSGEFTLHKRK
ncbi:hypothetical protein HME9304_03213 [Flagellimonas maritima]|uniref:Uncharacterized protein n=1 Tax=Flagellimonas maritima TaxID=1383885 RepID=A0A2Z4LW74_9FLAO|nr:hypothetical protein [Allomuricauda aurantiaca]AWX46181.1 hypothetical protein HME9304_03213 [Allomuricauda aurantiaca]